MTITTWLENVALARSSGTYLRYRDKIAKPDVLILDDMGMRKLSATEAQDLCEILEERSIGKSTVFTTPVTPSGGPQLEKSAGPQRENPAPDPDEVADRGATQGRGECLSSRDDDVMPCRFRDSEPGSPTWLF
jgi:IstB-like ATP binding protein